jgi:flagellar basal-body rod protein FlgG
VLSGFQSVPVGTTSINVSQNGMVSIQSASGTQTFQLTLARFANPSGLQSLGGNLYKETTASGTAETGQPSVQGFGTIMQGYDESSNVNLVSEMVNLITAQRAYEINSKSIQASDEMLQNVAQMKR